MLGYRPLNNRMAEIRDEGGNCKIFYHVRRAAIESGLSNSTVLKYAIDNDKSYVKKRSVKKKF